jgi:hypothetical protein
MPVLMAVIVVVTMLMLVPMLMLVTVGVIMPIMVVMVAHQCCLSRRPSAAERRRVMLGDPRRGPPGNQTRPDFPWVAQVPF